MDDLAGRWGERALLVEARAGARGTSEGAAAVLARAGDPAADAATPTPDQIRSLADRGALPPATLPTLTALWPSAIPRSGADVIRLAETTASILTAIGEAA